MKAIILAGGFGTRLAKISGEKPKPLVEVAGVPVLERMISSLYSHGIRDIRLSLHHKADQIIDFCKRKWPGKIEFVIEPEPLGTGGAIKYATRDTQGPFLALNGDAVSDINFSELCAEKPNIIACVYLKDARDFGLVKIKKGEIIDFLEKPKEKKAGFVNCGAYLLHPKIFTEMKEKKFMIEHAIFPSLAKKSGLRAYVHNGYWIDVGTEERFRQAHIDIAKKGDNILQERKFLSL